MPTTDREFNAIVTKLKEVFAAVHVLEGAEFEKRKKGDQDLRAKRCRQMDNLQAVDLSLVDRLLKLRGESGSQKSRRTDACLGSNVGSRCTFGQSDFGSVWCSYWNISFAGCRGYTEIAEVEDCDLGIAIERSAMCWFACERLGGGAE